MPSAPPILVRLALVLTVALLAGSPLRSEPAGRRPLTLDDLDRVRQVADPQVSPDGLWVAYTVTRADTAADKDDADVWMVSWDGARSVRLTTSPEGEKTPRWSPDGRYLVFLSSRGSKKEDETAQLWLLDRSGGEAERVSEVEGGIDDYAWAPDGKRLVLVVTDPDPEVKRAAEAKGDKKPKPRPIVIDRYHFKQDIVGYLGPRRSHLVLFDLASRKAEALTPGPFDESRPAWSPDGKWIAFVSKRAGADPDRSNNSDVFVMEPRAGAPARALTTWPGDDNESPSPLGWSPDSRLVAYLQGPEPADYAYGQDKLMVVPAAGGAPRALATDLDRPVASPVFTPDGRALVFRVVDDRSEHLARVAAAGGPVERLVDGKRVVSAFSAGPDGRLAVLAASDGEPPEIHALENGRLRRLSHHNDDWLAEVQLGATEEFTSKSKDGTLVNGLLVKPAGWAAGRRYPTVLRIHGGPNGQDEHAFSFERELLAAQGYLVAAANYRGSNGRGQAFQRAISADWGGKEVADLLGAIDHLVAAGLADPERLGVGGWSYGGILTNYLIATDPRFKAATSGASSSNQISMYGTDQYIVQYDAEMGPPWKRRDLWLKVSYPLFQADRIKTPTLFLCGEKDFNVPLLGSEQMYQALKTLLVPTELVIYPGQHHGLTVPSYRKDRLERYLAWYAKHLKEGLMVSKAGEFSRRFRIDDGRKFRLKHIDPGDTGGLASKKEAKAVLRKGVERLAELQEKLYAQDRWGLLLIFQAMDTAGKDGAIKHVMSGVNPQGTQVYSFKGPSAEELDHDFLWRSAKCLPERGRIGIFNRSYYEEVLVVRVHPEFLAGQKLPKPLVTRNIWKERFEDINNLETYLGRNGILVRKFFLHVSNNEQKKRFLSRLEEPEKNWKFSTNDAKERGFWNKYMSAYEDMIRHTATPSAPWYVVPADNKWFTRLVVAAAVIDALEGLNLHFPKVDEKQKKELEGARAILEGGS